MKKQKLFMLMLIWFVGSAGAGVFDFDDIKYWVGEGGNEAALVIDWNDGLEPESMAWGYRWDGTATGEDMFFAVTGQDTRFGGIKLTNYGTEEDPDYFVDGIGYDLTGEGFDWEDPDDHYSEGWWDNETMTGEWWGYFTYDGNANPWAEGESWYSPEVGMSTRELNDGTWDGWLFHDGGGDGPGFPVGAIPEPATVFLFGLASLVLLGRRRL